MIDALKQQIGSCFIGKEEVVENVLICLLSGGHILIEDVPGVGKTTLAKALAGSLDLSFGRIQFTPDTLPGDVTGVSIYNMKTQAFEYREGAIMRHILLADEINRTSPKTQAALLEAMEEGSVTVDGRTYDLPDPFMVIATQNPIEFIGTYPLPEASVDRFMMRLAIGYPDQAREVQMVRNQMEEKNVRTMQPVCDNTAIKKLKAAAAAVSVTDAVITYADDIVRLTRAESRFVLGASPRALLALVRAAKAKAYLQGRDYVKPDDIKAVALPVLHHRLTLTPEARIAGEKVDALLTALILKAKVPMEK
ncbi:MAG: MoxR family ATPase [Lachnospiraceae bacterium]|nr:MoxR family ATPase [Lachnospiraceae bacterium]